MSAASPPTQLDQHSAPLLTPSDGHARRPAAAYVADSPRRGAPDHSGCPDGQIKISSGKETTSRRLCGSRTWLRPLATLGWERSAAERNVFVPWLPGPETTSRHTPCSPRSPAGHSASIAAPTTPFAHIRRPTEAAAEQRQWLPAPFLRDGEVVPIPILAPAADATDDDLLQLFLIPARFQPIRSVFRVAQGGRIDPTGKAWQLVIDFGEAMAGSAHDWDTIGATATGDGELRVLLDVPARVKAGESTVPMPLGWTGVPGKVADIPGRRLNRTSNRTRSIPNASGPPPGFGKASASWVRCPP